MELVLMASELTEESAAALPGRVVGKEDQPTISSHQEENPVTKDVLVDCMEVV